MQNNSFVKNCVDNGIVLASIVDNEIVLGVITKESYKNGETYYHFETIATPDSLHIEMKDEPEETRLNQHYWELHDVYERDGKHYILTEFDRVEYEVEPITAFGRNVTNNVRMIIYNSIASAA